ncbi:MAG: phosphoketolase, partial [Halothiobacillus sp.]
MSNPTFTQGIQYFNPAWPRFDELAKTPAVPEGATAIADVHSEAAAFQTLLTADALRYLTLQITGSKGSGHPGGYASSADVHAALMLLGHKNMVTEVGHHAPGFYSAMFLDRSLEHMGIHTVEEMRARFR